MPENMGVILAIIAFLLVCIVGLFCVDIPVSKILFRGILALAIFTILGRIYFNLGQDFFREILINLRRKKEKEKERLKTLIGEEGKNE